MNILTILLVTIIISNCKLNNKSKISFEQYFDESMDNYEFLVKNPDCFYPSYYFPNLEGLKNKYIVEITEDYQMDREGNKYYGDGDIYETYYKYYKFDNEGRIEKIYLIVIDNLGNINGTVQQRYETTDNKFIVIGYDPSDKEEWTLEYLITTDSEKIFFDIEDESGERHQTIYENGKITDIKYWPDGIIIKEEFQYTKDNILYKSYDIINDEEELVWTWTYKNGAIQEKIRSNDFYETIDTYVINEEGKGKKVHKYTRDGETTISSNYLERRYHDLGFLEYEIECPQKDGGAGSYKILNRKLLDEPDELLIKYFGDVIEKE